MSTLFLRTDRIKTVIYLSTIIVLALCLIFSKTKVSEIKGHAVIIPDENYIATGKHFIELLYSLNAASIDEDSFLLTQMIHKDNAEKIEEHTKYIIDNEIVKRVKESNLKSRIHWNDVSASIEHSSKRARVISFKGRYEYKTEAMQHYKSKPIYLAVSLVEDVGNPKARYGVSVYDWETPAHSSDNKGNDA